MANIRLLPRAVYHLTDEEHVSSILTDGLTALPGRPVYLCDKESISKWSILLDRHILLRVETSDYHALNDDTLLSTHSVHARHISLSTDNLVPSDDDRMSLCIAYIMKLSAFVIDCYDYYKRRSKISLKHLKSTAAHLVRFLPCLPYGQENPEYWKQLIEFADVNEQLTFCDTYDDRDTRFWELLIRYPHDTLTKSREAIYDFISRTFPFARTLSTGLGKI